MEISSKHPCDPDEWSGVEIILYFPSFLLDPWDPECSYHDNFIPSCRMLTKSPSMSSHVAIASAPAVSSSYPVTGLAVMISRVCVSV